MVALRYVSRINGLTHINLTKLDVLDVLEEIKVGGAAWLAARSEAWLMCGNVQAGAAAAHVLDAAGIVHRDEAWLKLAAQLLLCMQGECLVASHNVLSHVLR
jgi:hypothetical protein